MSDLTDLRSAKSIHDLAKLLGYKPQALSYIIYKISETEKYFEFNIAKKSDGHRTIKAPSEKLKRLQKKVVQLLSDCLVEIKEQTKNPFSHGFVKGCSIVTNARIHRNKKWLLNFDIQDFFGSINYGRVRGILIKDRNFQLHPKVATLLAQIACHQNSLPQGAPTSPILSNIVAKVLDLRLLGVAKKYGCLYSRYVDDISFSSSNESYNKFVIKQENSNWVLSTEISNLIIRSGFQENPEKTRLQFRRNRRVVTGLVVNKRINVTREYRKLVRVMVNSLVTTGAFKIPPVFEARSSSNKVYPNSMRQLEGMLGYIDYIDSFSKNCYKNIYIDRMREDTKSKSCELNKLSSQEKTYRRFLFYKNFYMMEKPLILTEGKTDKGHLQIAIDRLGKDYPDLIDMEAKNLKIHERMKFKIFPSFECRRNAILGITGGAGNIQKFLNVYEKETKNFNRPVSLRPIIVLLDNDSATKRMKDKMKDKEIKIQSLKEIFYVCKNLYLVFLPLPEEVEEAAIEDLYPREILKTKLGEKEFNKSNRKIDESKFYGKTDFLERVVRRKIKDIDFGGFKPLFDRLKGVIEYCKNENKSWRPQACADAEKTRLLNGS